MHATLRDRVFLSYLCPCNLPGMAVIRGEQRLAEGLIWCAML